MNCLDAFTYQEKRHVDEGPVQEATNESNTRFVEFSKHYPSAKRGMYTMSTHFENGKRYGCAKLSGNC